MLRIVVQRGGEIVADRSVESPLVTIGRSHDCDVVLDDPSVSSRHLILKRNSSRDWLLIDESANGTMIGGEKVKRHRFERPLIANVAMFELTLIPADRSGTDSPHREKEKAQLASTTERDTLPDIELDSARHARLDAELRQISGTNEKTIIVGESALLGRGSECDLQLAGRDVSRRHALIFRSGEHFAIRRLSRGSKVVINGTELAAGEQIELNDGDLIVLASHELLYFQPATQARFESSAAQPPAAPNLDLHVERRNTAVRGIAAYDLIGFLGAKTSQKLEAAILPSLGESERMIVDAGYLIGLDSQGIQTLGRILNEAERRGIRVQLIRLSGRVSDIISESPMKNVLLPFIARSEESAIRRLNSPE